MKKFVILAPARSGSKMLTERLGSHPDVHVRSELLNINLHHRVTERQSIYARVGRKLGLTKAAETLRFNGRNSTEILDKLVWGQPYQKHAASGFKIIFAQWLTLSQDQQSAFLNLHDPKVILLHRRDVLSHLVSTRQGELYGFRHRRHGQPPLKIPPVELTLEDLRIFQRNIHLQSCVVRFAFSKFPIIETSYEDLVSNPERENARLLEFLGVRPWHLTEVLAKNTGDALSQRICGYQDFARSLRGTAYEHMLPNMDIS